LQQGVSARAGSCRLAAVLAWAGLAACNAGRHDLSTEQLARAVDAQRPALKRCYDAALEQHPYKQEMRIEAIIHIAPSGKVSAVELEGGGGLPGMNACLRQAILTWTFPRAEDPTDTSLPLIFKPEVVKQQQPGNLDAIKQALEQLKQK
jgi:hypothetical protein